MMNLAPKFKVGQSVDLLPSISGSLQTDTMKLSVFGRLTEKSRDIG